MNKIKRALRAAWYNLATLLCKHENKETPVGNIQGLYKVTTIKCKKCGLEGVRIE